MLFRRTIRLAEDIKDLALTHTFIDSNPLFMPADIAS